MKIGLTTFLDFTAAAGTSRLTVVRKARQQEGHPYSPATDYWRPLREGIKTQFESGWDPKTSLKTLRNVTGDPKKVERYNECIDGLATWTKKKTFGRSTKKTKQWAIDALTITVNPELALSIDDAPTVVKLYFKAEKLSKPRVDTLLYLLHKSFPRSGEVGILDVPRGRLIQETVDIPALDVVLAGDAAQFITMWNLLETQDQA
jgi:hypothetical protein